MARRSATLQAKMTAQAESNARLLARLEARRLAVLERLAELRR